MKPNTAIMACYSLLVFLLPFSANSDTFKCDTETYDLLKNISESALADGEIFVFTTTHQDIGWIDHPEACIAMRDSLWLTPFLERLETDPDFMMDIEQASIVKEYIGRHPDKKDIMSHFMADGRISVGGTYIQPYEEMYSGESLARQFYFGRKWLRDNFDGYNAKSYFNVDVPGRTLQMPQIMRKAGISNLIISRQQKGLYNWEAPDGSSVRTYSSGDHYMLFYSILGKSNPEAVKAIATEAIDWYTVYNTDTSRAKAVMPAMLNYEFIWDQKPVANCAPFMKLWNGITAIEDENGQRMAVSLPKFRYATADEFFDRLDTTTPNLTSIHGERPDVWLYIHGPSHHHAQTLSREGDILLTAAEKFATIDALIKDSFSGYPSSRFNETWEAKIYPDHGWGGNNGIITDNLFLQKYAYAKSEAQSILDTSVRSIASHIKTTRDNTIPVVLFNSLSWNRTDVASFTISLDRGVTESIAVQDGNGATIPSQLSDTSYHADGTLKRATVTFIAREIPSLGYKTYHIVPTAEKQTVKDNIVSSIENDFYAIDLAPGGIKKIYDKELGRDILDISKFLGCEVFTMKSEGNGAGEFDAVQLPTMGGFDKISNHAPVWKVVESGPVYTSVALRSPIRHATVDQTIRVYHGIKKIDVDITIGNWESILYRGFRMALPVSITDGQVSYEVPYGVLNAGHDEMKGPAGGRYQALNETLHPRGIENWISVSGNDFGVTMSSSVSVADYIDPTDEPSDNTILQPILFASRKSCHWLGNEYLQHGSHSFSFSITSHKDGWENGARFGREANEKLLPVINPTAYKEARLPEEYGFFACDNPNIVISAVKKAENDDAVIVRVYNTTGTDTTISLSSFQPIQQITHSSLIEEELNRIDNDNITISGFGIETFKLEY